MYLSTTNTHTHTHSLSLPQLKIGSFPTIKLFTKRNKKGIDFSGPRVSRAFGDFLTTHTTPPKKQ